MPRCSRLSFEYRCFLNIRTSRLYSAFRPSIEKRTARLLSTHAFIWSNVISSYISLLARPQTSSRLFTFVLDGNAEMPPVAPGAAVDVVGRRALLSNDARISLD